jgi:hypothetical protein
MIDGLRGTLREDYHAIMNQNPRTNPKEKSKEEVQLDEENKNVEILMKEDIYAHFKEFEFTRLIRNPKVVEKLVYKFFEIDPKRIRDTMHLKIVLPYTDRRLFSNFRDYKITYDQLLSRVEKIRFG